MSLAYVALGANGDDPAGTIGRALAALEAEGIAVAACARIYVGPYIGDYDEPAPELGVVHNTVAEVRTDHAPLELLQVLLDVEKTFGRVRDGSPVRVIDLDLLAVDDVLMQTDDLVLPHPRCLIRGFVLEPWREIAPIYPVPGTGQVVSAFADKLRAQHHHVWPEAAAPLPDHGSEVVQLDDAAALAEWRNSVQGSVGVVPTMGALHHGHLSLVRKARAECGAVLATIFVNPLQFGEGEDLERYPRTLEADIAALSRMGADAVYVPAPDDLYPEGFATHIAPSGAAEGYEGAARPGHFGGVATVVAKLWQRTCPDRSYFGRKDAQQVAVLQQLHRDLDFGGELVVCPTVRAVDGLALSSRNRYLDDAQRKTAVSLARGLEAMGEVAGAGERRALLLKEVGRRPIELAGAEIEYLDVVDPVHMRALDAVEGPALAIAVVRVGDVRLLDNRWLVVPGGRS